jgi:hypothetical protein
MSMHANKKLLLTFAFACAFACPWTQAQAQESTADVGNDAMNAEAIAAADIQESKGSAEARTRSAPLRLAQAQPLPFGSVLDVESDFFSILSRQHSVRLVDFPLGVGNTVDLELEQFWVTAPGTRFVEANDRGEVEMEAPVVTLLRGKVAGRDDSRVFLGIQPTVINGVIRIGDEEFIVAPLQKPNVPGRTLDHVIYERLSAGAFLETPTFDCEALRAPFEDFEEDQGQSEPVPYALGTNRVGLVAFDCDWEFRQLFSSVAQAAGYAVVLAAASSTIYDDDVFMQLAVSYVRVWNTSADPFTATNTADSLDELKDLWQSTMGSIQRNTAHLLSGRLLGGGRAWLDGMCGGQWAYGVDANLVGTFPVPLTDGDTGNWDVYVLTHELGHNFGARHTHCLSPPVDRCDNSESGCFSGTPVCQQGTIMSYCHQCPGGLANMDLEFHTASIGEIQSSLRSCVLGTITPVYVDHRNTGSENGSLANPFNTVVEGTWYVLPNGEVRIASGTYSSDGIYGGRLVIARPMRLVHRNDSASSVIISP